VLALLNKLVGTLKPVWFAVFPPSFFFFLWLWLLPTACIVSFLFIPPCFFFPVLPSFFSALFGHWQDGPFLAFYTPVLGFFGGGVGGGVFDCGCVLLLLLTLFLVPRFLVFPFLF